MSNPFALNSVSFATLEDRGIYSLPDGQLFVAINSEEGGFVLYVNTAWNAAAPADYEVQPDGNITFQGRPSGWTAADLTPTEWTIDDAQNPIRSEFTQDHSVIIFHRLTAAQPEFFTDAGGDWYWQPCDVGLNLEVFSPGYATAEEALAAAEQWIAEEQ